MKRVPALLALCLLFTLCSCSDSGSSDFGPCDMLDNDTGEVYSLGMSRDVFDTAFGSMPIEENELGWTEYLDGVLSVTFENDVAMQIRCDATTNRFSFYNFDFSMDMSDIEGRYEKSDSSYGYVHYHRYYDDKGNDVSIGDSTVSCSLMIYDSDLDILGRDEDDGYISFSVRYSGWAPVS